MKNFLQNLLIFFALALCGLAAFQWHREAKLRTNIQSLTDDLQKQRETALGLDASVKRLEAEVVRIDGLKNEVTTELKTNKAEVARLKVQLQKNDQQFELMTKQAENYKGALDAANESITKQNESIKTQNEEMKKLATERNEIVERLNKTVTDYNDLVKKWNEQQEQLSKRATNSAKPGAQSHLQWHWGWRG